MAMTRQEKANTALERFMKRARPLLVDVNRDADALLSIEADRQAVLYEMETEGLVAPGELTLAVEYRDNGTFSINVDAAEDPAP